MKKVSLLVFLLTISLINLDAQQCGTLTTEELKQNNPAHAAQLEQIEEHTQEHISNLNEQKSAMVVTIPTVFHVIHTGATSTSNNIPESYILAQLEQLNDDFRRLNSDADNTWSQAADTEIEFCLASIDPNGNPTTGINRYQYSTGTWSNTNINNTIKPATIWNRNDYLNIWLVPEPFVPGLSGTLLGYAQFPGGSASTDGVVNRTSTTGSLSTPNPSGGSTGVGRTCTHEVGHWLNLRHIWGDGPCGFDDLVADTPESDDSNGGCPVGHVSCGSVDMVQNYMDYTNGSCMNLFTTGQKNRMRALFGSGGARASLLNSAGCDTGGGGPCAGQGGDSDGDGVCANADCNDNNPNIPTTPGTACNDGDSNTTNDVIQADGCTCQGTTVGGDDYCTSQGNSTQYEYIQSVNVAGINNSSGNNNGYANYTSQTATANAGASYNITLTPGFVSTPYTEYWKVWVDFNQDGDFNDSGEELLSQSSGSTISSSITIPSSAPTGTTRMRISMKYNAASTSCETFTYGEVEDYSITIGGGSPCSGQGGDNDGDGVCANADCNDNNPNIPTTPGTVCNDGDSNTTNDVIQADGCTCQGTTPCAGQGGDNDGDGVCANTDCNDNNPNIPTTPGTSCNDGNSNTVNDVIQADGCTCQGTTAGGDDYCTSQGNSTQYEYIQNVNVAGINNSSGNNNGYADYTSQTASVSAGTSYSIILTPGFVSTAYPEYWKVWVDFNQDGDFNDSGEELLNQGSSSTISSSITIPSSAPSGTTRMRVSMKYNAAPTSCETFTYGEVEDYSISIGGGGNACAGQGGDNDGDGICANTDCNDNNSNIPTTPGTACNDGNSNTINDVIQADGCTCQGTTSASCNAPTPTANQINNAGSVYCEVAYGYCYGHAGINKQFELTNLSNGNINTGTTSEYYILLSGLSQSTNYRYRVRLECDNTGTYGDWSPYQNFTTPSCKLETEMLNLNNYPNPFNDFTTIEFSLTEDSPVTLEVYDLTGRRVAALLDNESIGAGNHRIRFDGNRHPSGVYIYVIHAGTYTGTGKMNLMK